MLPLSTTLIRGAKPRNQTACEDRDHPRQHYQGTSPYNKGVVIEVGAARPGAKGGCGIPSWSGVGQRHEGVDEQLTKSDASLKNLRSLGCSSLVFEAYCPDAKEQLTESDERGHVIRGERCHV